MREAGDELPRGHQVEIAEVQSFRRGDTGWGGGGRSSSVLVLRCIDTYFTSLLPLNNSDNLPTLFSQSFSPYTNQYRFSLRTNQCVSYTSSQDPEARS